jgi:hypothetical protein
MTDHNKNITGKTKEISCLSIDMPDLLVYPCYNQLNRQNASIRTSR